jgi:hypothetical protein
MAAGRTHDDTLDDHTVDDDDLEDDLTDDELSSEIELVSELVVAATFSDRPLYQDEVDQLLGIELKADSPTAESER